MTELSIPSIGVCALYSPTCRREINFLFPGCEGQPMAAAIAGDQPIDILSRNPNHIVFGGYSVYTYTIEGTTNKRNLMNHWL